MTVEGYNLNLSMKIFMTGFYFFTFMIHSFYECNLRAYLMKNDLEPYVDTPKDMIDQGRKLFIQLEYSEKDYYAALPDELHHYIKRAVAETYANKYHYLVIPDEDNTDYMFLNSHKFEKVTTELIMSISLGTPCR